MVGRCQPVETEVDGGQQVRRTERYHRAEKVTEDVDHLQPRAGGFHELEGASQRQVRYPVEERRLSLFVWN